MATRVKGFRDIDFGDEFTVSIVGGKAEVSAPLVPASPLPAYTQTYSTATRTHGQTAASTSHALSVVFSDAEAEAALNALGTRINELKQLVNGLIDDLQEAGLLG